MNANSDNNLIGKAQCAFQDIHMAVCHRVEGARIDRDCHFFQLAFSDRIFNKNHSDKKIETKKPIERDVNTDFTASSQPIYQNRRKFGATFSFLKRMYAERI
ncbi:hypothetical protein FGI60_10495 [Brucella haematophila]|nr:hypothetical protein F9K79_09335 [Ochrobactrum sp. Kaboul]TMV03591.1 hypothetical protein FGI60_10495 [Brucella haematophila]